MVLVTPLDVIGMLDLRYEGITQKLKWNVPIRGSGDVPPLPPLLPPPQTSELQPSLTSADTD